MEVEEEFLNNASTMVSFAQKEIKQFLTWTNSNTQYGTTAESIIKHLESITLEIKRLKKEYNNR